MTANIRRRMFEVDSEDWLLDAACLEHPDYPTNYWFPVGDINEGTTIDQERLRAETCSQLRCAVMEECFEYALAVGARAGIWGGQSFSDRRAITKIRKARREAEQERAS